MTKKSIYTLGVILSIALIALFAYGQYFRSLRIWVDGAFFKVSGPGQLHGIKVYSRLKGSPESDFESSWAGVAVPLWGSDGDVSTFTVPNPKNSGTEFELTSDTMQFVEATSSSGVEWAYKIQLLK